MREDFGPDDDYFDRDDEDDNAVTGDLDIPDFEDDEEDYNGRHEPGCDENGTMWD